MTQSGVRNQGLRWRQGLETCSKSKAPWREQGRSTWEWQRGCDLDLPLSMSAGDVPFSLSLRLSAGPNRVLKRLNQNRQGGRKLFPISLWSQYVSWLTHTPAIRSCIGSPKAPCTPGFQCARCASTSETCSLHHLAGERLLIFWVDLTNLWDPQFFVSVLSFLLR